MFEEFDDLNKEVGDIYEQLKNVYEKFSNKNEKRKEEETVWDKIFPGVLLMKNVELIQNQMDELLELTKKQEIEVQFNEFQNLDNKVKDDMDLIIEYKDEDTKKCEELKRVEEELKNAIVIEDFEEKKNTNMDERPSQLVLDVIKLRDQVLIAQTDADESIRRILGSLYKELGRILSSSGVKTLPDEEGFNNLYHTVVETKKTNDQGLKDKIAGRYRPGYSINGKIIRSQEVAIYVYEEEEL